MPEIILNEKEEEARERVCIALDVPKVEDALNLAGELSDFVNIFKVGKQLHTAAGNQGVNIFKEIYDRGGYAFGDLKFHDTPNTVYQAARAITVPGVYLFNIHIAGGEEQCKKAVEGATERANELGIDRPKVIGVTVLTSLDDKDLEAQKLGINYEDLVMKRTELAKEWGLDGVVCPANIAGQLENKFYDALGSFIYVTPGIKWAGKAGTGQKQLYTPDLAVKDCSSSILVIGSAVTKADDRRGTAYDILQAMAKEL